MKAVMFVCHGNICRSPTAEFVMKDILKRKGKDGLVTVASSATSAEELGNAVYPSARRVIEKHGINCAGKRAVRLKKDDYAKYDIFVCMDSRNVANALRIFGSDPDGKITLLTSAAGKSGEIEDPWYSGNFDGVYDQIRECCESLAEKLFSRQ